MSQSFLDRAQTVGYEWANTKTLVVCLTKKMADKMKADGWDIKFEKDIGHFITIEKEE